MQNLSKNINKRIVAFLGIFLGIVVMYLFANLVQVQLVNHKFLSQAALEQWTRGEVIEPKRGTIYDSKGRKLAITVKKSNIYAIKRDMISTLDQNKSIVKEQRFSKKEKENIYTSIDEVVGQLSSILKLNSKDLKKKIESSDETNQIDIKKGVDESTAEKLREARIPGIIIEEDNRRFYPKGKMASYVIGHTSEDGKGVYGIEAKIDNMLSGVEGKYVYLKDPRDRKLPNTEIRKYPAEDGNNVYLTIDSRIQEIVEEAIRVGEINTGAKKVAAIVMQPKTGDILAMASTPGYDLNNPNYIEDEKKRKDFEKLDNKEQLKELYELWRNYNVSDNYEPGSTFKPLVVCGALEENVIDEDYTFTCDGFLTDIKSDTPIKCWRWYDPHGFQTLKEGLANSCNDMMGDIGLKLGGNLLYKYIIKLGYGEITGINTIGEEVGIIPRSGEDIKDATLANISFGQSISATPIQHITALSAIANGGNLVTPNLIKQIKNKDGKTIQESKPIIKRKVFSKEKSKKVLDYLGFVAKKYNFLSVPGYNIGAKTGTSQKSINGRYSNERYVGSFVGIAPLENPEFIVLVVIDEPSRGAYYGSEVAGPVGETIVNETLKYLKIEPTKDINDNDNLIQVPDVRNMKLKEAKETLKKVGLDYNSEEYYMTPDDLVEEQSPLPGELVPFRSFVDLTLAQSADPESQRVPTEEEMIEAKRIEAERRKAELDKEKKGGFKEEKEDENNKMKENEKKDKNIEKVPNLVGKSYEEVLKTIEKLGVRISKKGEVENGTVVSQSPKAGSKIKPNTIIEIKLK